MTEPPKKRLVRPPTRGGDVELTGGSFNTMNASAQFASGISDGGWAWYGRNSPAAHRGVVAAELAEIGSPLVATAVPKLTAARIWQVFRDRNALLLFGSGAMLLLHRLRVAV